MKRLLAVAMLCSGCISTHPEAWGPSGEDPSLKRAIYACKHDADNEAHRAAAFGGAIVPIVGLFSRQSKFDACMESLGYRRR